MFRCLPVRARHLPCALLLSIPFVLPVDALADQGQYRVRDEARSNGVRVVQQVDSVIFPRFEGSRPSSSAPDAPGIEAGQLRAVRAVTQRRGDSTLAIVSQDGAASIVVEFFNRHVRLTYRGPSVSESSNPFVGRDKETRWKNNGWEQTVATGGPLSAEATHFVVTLYALPRTGDPSQPKGKGNLVVTVNEATVQGMRVIGGRVLVDKATLAVDENNGSRWRQAPLRAGVLADEDAETQNPATAFTRHPLFVEQRTLDLRTDESTRRRDKRCVNSAIHEMSNLLLPALLEVYFGRADLCSLDPHPNQDIAAPLPLVEVTDPQDVPRIPEPTVFEAAALDPADLGYADAFDAAMGIEFCNANHRAGPDEQPCTDEDRRESAAIGELTPQAIDDLLAQIARMYQPDQQGPATLRTGNADLDRWLNADLVRAEQALIRAKSIARLSGAAEEPTIPIKKKRKKTDDTKTKVLKTSCAIDKQDNVDGDDEYRVCVRKGKKKIRRTEGETGPFVALTPHIDDGTRFHLRNTARFTPLVREFLNTNGNAPNGMSNEEFTRFTAAIARDAAPTGDNLGIVYLNDPSIKKTDRFKYGLEHIWAPGSGGGANAGHRGDWEDNVAGLSVNTRAMLTELIMTALTDPYAQFTQTRGRNGNVVRTYKYFTFTHGQRVYAISNVRIVIGQNGMVITAYPLDKAKAVALDM